MNEIMFLSVLYYFIITIICFIVYGYGNEEGFSITEDEMYDIFLIFIMGWALLPVYTFYLLIRFLIWIGKFLSQLKDNIGYKLYLLRKSKK